MKNKVKKTLDKSNRLVIPIELLELAKIECNSKAALCTVENGIKIVSLKNIKDSKVIGTINIGEKGRFVFPSYLLDVEREFSIYCLNGGIYIEPTGN